MDSFFWFRKEEFRGVMVIVLLSSGLALLSVYAKKSAQIPPLDEQQRKRYEQLWLAEDRRSKEEEKQAKQFEPQEDAFKKERSWELHGRFDPNTAQDSEWLKRGISEKQLKSIRKYCSYGAHFASIDDLKKVYVLSDEWVDFYESDFQFPAQQLKEKPKEKKEGEERREEAMHLSSTVKKKERLNINLADTTAFKSIYGIGSYYANKLVKYRESLGGYHSMNQLNEIYNMREEVLLVLQESCFLQEGDQQCLPINEASEEELAQHPYLSRNQSKALVAFRNEHGPFHSEQELLKCVVMNEATVLKIRPYLCLQTP